MHRIVYKRRQDLTLLSAVQQLPALLRREKPTQQQAQRPPQRYNTEQKIR